MNIERLIALLKTKEDFIKSTQYGYVEVLPDKLGDNFSFQEEAALDRFANSKSDDVEQIVLKINGEKKTLFIALQEYDLIIVFEGKDFTLSQLWKRQDRKAEVHSLDCEKFKVEILKHFLTSKNQKLAS